MKTKGIIVKDEHYMVLASILNDFGEGRHIFAFEDFANVLKALGFARLDSNTLVPPRRFGNQAISLFKDGGRKGRVVGAKMQDEWKVVLFRLYGWTAETFRTR